MEQPEHQADLIKAILALANHGGGYVLIGFREDNGEYISIDIDMSISNLYNQDRINGIVAKYADPKIHVDCYKVSNESKEHPVIVVSGGYAVPIRCIRGGPEGKHLKQNAYYIRRLGPASEEPQTGQEWADFIRRCVLADKEQLVEQLKSLLTGELSQIAEEGTPINEIHESWLKSAFDRFIKLNINGFGALDKSPFQRGYWLGAYSVIPKIEGLNLSSLKNGLQKCVGNETGWPIGLFLPQEETKPYPHDGCVEVWLAKTHNEPGHSDYWRASQNGNFIVIRGFQEDSNGLSKEESGKTLDFIIPIWRVGELLLHASRFVKEFSPKGCSLIVSMKWSGLNDRYLTTSSPEYFPPSERKSVQDEATSTIIIQDALSIETNLLEFVEQLLQRLFEVFDFYQVPKQTIVYELNKMRNRR